MTLASKNLINHPMKAITPTLNRKMIRWKLMNNWRNLRKNPRNHGLLLRKSPNNNFVIITNAPMRSIKKNILTISRLLNFAQFNVKYVLRPINL